MLTMDGPGDQHTQTCYPPCGIITDVKEIYLKCIRSGLKGMTVFRDRCLEQQAIYALDACPECSQSHYLQPGDCAGWKCDKERGGCSWETCSIA